MPSDPPAPRTSARGGRPRVHADDAARARAYRVRRAARLAGGADVVADLRAELAAAYRLVGEERARVRDLERVLATTTNQLRRARLGYDR